MFQPQATPFSPFSSYGVGGSVGDFPPFQPGAVGNGGGGVIGEGGGATLIADSGGPTVFRETVFSPVATNNHLDAHLSYPHNNLNPNAVPSQQQRYIKMLDHDVEAQELAAREFERDRKFEGPTVGDKKSSHAITEEYAKADPVYVAKTRALPQRYSHFRRILGDGNCGWRAIAFSYYECLLRSHSKAHLEEEIVRIKSLNNLLATAGGYETWIIEDMTDQTTDLLRELAEVIESSPEAAADLLLERFRDVSSASSIIYHLRLLASAKLASRPTLYQDFIPDGLSVDAYRKNCLETVDTEIEHLGMQLLTDALLKPLEIAVEVVYLDRSEGSQANSHFFQSEDSNGLPLNPGGPMIHLLYRPSHYDILYRESNPFPNQQFMEDLSRSSSIQVKRATALRHNSIHDLAAMADFPQLDLTTLLNIPGYMPMPQSHLGFQTQYQSPIDQSYAHSPIATSVSPISPGPSVTTPSSTSTLPQSYPHQHVGAPHQAPSPSSLSTPQNLQTFPNPSTQLPFHSHIPSNINTSRPSFSPQHSLSSDLSSPTSATNSFRPSKYEYTAAAEWHEPVIPQTSSFKNSHYNTAHYNNPNFQPEEWTPESEEAPVLRKQSR